jgi:hypothetical protein
MKLRSCFSFTANRRQKSVAGFSFVDLLTVLGVLALLVLLQISAFAHNKGNSHRAVCADNLRRLAISWMMYADDNRGGLAPNRSDAFPATNNWVAGWLDFSGSTDNTNPATITQARLYPYNKAVEIYRCPDDLSARRDPQYGYQMRVRSYSMNSWLGDGASGWIGSPTAAFQIMANSSQIRQPDQTFVFIEEHPDSINDGAFVIDVSAVGPAARLIDFPAAYHYYGVNLGFADGSARYRQWLDPRTSPSRPIIFVVPSPNNPDVAWLQRVTTYRK